MAAHPPPPVVTITNPADPRPLSDVIGYGPARPPRKLSRTQVRLAWLTAVILATTAAGVLAVARINEARRLDREALREVGLLASSQGISPLESEGVAPLVLLSTGSHPLTVLSASLGLPGFPPLAAHDNTLQPDEPGVVYFTMPATCPRSVPWDTETPLVLTVRTYRGDERTVRIPAGGDAGFGAAFFFQTMERCALFPVELSIVNRLPTSSTQQGRELLLTLPVSNRSRATRTISDMTVNGGLLLRSHLPTTTIPGNGTATLQVRLAIRDCSEALSVWAFTPQTGPEASFRGTTGGGTLNVLVSGDGTTASTALLGAGDDVIAPWIAGLCPA